MMPRHAALRHPPKELYRSAKTDRIFTGARRLPHAGIGLSRKPVPTFRADARFDLASACPENRFPLFGPML
jgi:hypothetical protein